MAGTKNDTVIGKNADFSQAGGPNATSGEANGLATNGQLWIGTTAVNAGGTHINVGSFTSPNNSITFGYSTPNVTAVVNTAVVQDLHVAKWIVNGTPNAGGNVTTITAALAAAVSGETIFVMPGTYTENLTLKAGVDIVSFNADALTPNTTIVGKLTATFSGTCSLSGLCLKTNSDYCLEVTGSGATIIQIKDCNIIGSNSSTIHHTTSNALSKLEFRNCRADLQTTGIAFFVSTSPGALKFYGGVWENNGLSTTASTYASSGGVSFYNCFFAAPITMSSTGTFTGISSQFYAPLIIGSTGVNYIAQAIVSGGTASSISVGAGATLICANCAIDSTNTNAITGLGTLNYGLLVFTNSSSTVNTSTLTPLATLI